LEGTEGTLPFACQGFLVGVDASTPLHSDSADVESVELELDEEEIRINVIVRLSRNEDLSIQLHNSNLRDINPIALINSGSQGWFVDESMVGTGRTRKLRRAIIAKNVDGTRNSAGTITHETRIKYRIGEQGFEEWFMITKLGDQKLILGIVIRSHSLSPTPTSQ
jgi:hypothetical protein